MLNIITKQLSEALPQSHYLQKNRLIDPTNFEEIYYILKSNPCNNINVYDATIIKNIEAEQTIIVKDHINNTGTNILIGQQKKLNIDFIDMANIYTPNQNSVITTCCGERLDINIKHPCHYLCHITMLARTMQFKNITGYLYNII